MTSSGEAAVRFARSVVDAEVGRADAPGVPDGPGFARSAGAFVTLETYPVGDLRGCIGIPLPVMPLGGAIASAARSACHDPRFPDLRASELDRITVEVTILTPPVPIQGGPERISGSVTIGRDGLLIRFMGRTGLFLPQVPVEQGWDVDEYLDNLCMKAGLPPGTWRREGAVVEKFQGEAWHETSPYGDVVRRDDIGPRSGAVRSRLCGRGPQIHRGGHLRRQDRDTGPDGARR